MKGVSRVLLVLGLLAAAYCGWEFMKAQRYQSQASQQFIRERPVEQPETSEEQTAATPGNGEAIGMLTIPRLGLSTVVVEGAGDRELELGPGHIPGTALPGQGENVGLAGHRDTVFRPLRSIRINDEIDVRTHDQEYRYKVVSTMIVDPKDVHVLYPTGRETLTLITCYPFTFVGNAPKRFVVRAESTSLPAL